jgi:hypothetical protein
MSCGNGCGGCTSKAEEESDIEIQEKRIQLSRAEMEMWYEAIMCQGPLVHEVIRQRVEDMLAAVPADITDDTARMTAAYRLSQYARHAKTRGEQN